MTDLIRLERDAHVARVTINRPEKKNALTPQMNADLFEALGQAEADNDIRAIVLTGAGDTFCSGADITWHCEHVVEPLMSEPAEVRYQQGVAAMIPQVAGENEGLDSPDYVRLMLAMKTPIVAAMNGSALGKGLTITLPCDLRIISGTARVGMLFVRLGVVPDFGALHLLPRLVGVAHALDLCLTGRSISAEEAYRMGLISQIVDASEVLPRAMELAEQIAALPSVPVGFIRQALHRDQSQGIEDALEFQRLALAICRLSPEYLAALGRAGPGRLS